MSVKKTPSELGDELAAKVLRAGSDRIHYISDEVTNCGGATLFRALQDGGDFAIPCGQEAISLAIQRGIELDREQRRPNTTQYYRTTEGVCGLPYRVYTNGEAYWGHADGVLDLSSWDFDSIQKRGVHDEEITPEVFFKETSDYRVAQATKALEEELNLSNMDLARATLNLTASYELEAKLESRLRDVARELSDRDQTIDRLQADLKKLQEHLAGTVQYFRCLPGKGWCDSSLVLRHNGLQKRWLRADGSPDTDRDAVCLFEYTDRMAPMSHQEALDYFRSNMKPAPAPLVDKRELKKALWDFTVIQEILAANIERFQKVVSDL